MMTGKQLLAAAAFLLLSALAGQAESFTDWRNGDLIFHDSNSSQSAAIRLATGSPYTHMGIVRVSTGEITVIEAGRTVTETPLAAFIARGTGEDYAVYRLRDLSKSDAGRALEAAMAFAGRPYDIFFRLDPDALYCSELPFHAFGNVGISLGQVQQFGELSINTPEGRALFLDRWQEHPDCRAQGVNREGCWNLLRGQEVVTPVSIARDPLVEQIYSGFPP
ncbi:hypothetical protein M3484_04600 [Pseudomonas sp. GX19020]|uniref:YiiX/YebB-like N1pC/P60 family cysteine hydrolase n=1 Tax=Pseudomonas sp. GX19020 TaxID=2942277 RepID=UPI002018E97E|nr:YiiX/YebB-like N1pC/P60 family cysteine hydrolase [Pseudomonas sp. GX19020]MCL4065843.1 hypothetical protein [Pseudomonas sp. GX19020]